MLAPTQRSILLGLVSSMLLFACGGGGDADTTTAPVDSLKTEDQRTDGGLMKVGERLFAVPSPVQTAIMLQKAGASYQKDLLIPLDKGATAPGIPTQAMLMGMYGADLGYATMFKDGSRALSTLQTIEKLGASLNLGNAFDRAMIDRFKANMGSEDSLLRYSGVAFRAADEYLKNDQREDVSAMVLAGGWVEALYLAVSDSKAGTDAGIQRRIGEQRSSIQSVIGLLEDTDQNGACAEVVAELKDLAQLYSALNSTYQFEKPVTEVASKTTYIQSTSQITITPEQLAGITAKVKAIRAKIIA